MPELTKIRANDISANAITADKISSAVALGGPKIALIDYPGDDTAALPAGGQSITIVGSGFVSGATVYLDGVVVSPVTFNNANSITFTAPAKTANSYVLYVINPDGGTAIAVPGITYSGVPTWTTSAGSLGAPYETNSFSVTLQATSDSNVTFSMSAGNTLPSGLSLAANGLLSGTIPATEANTTYTFYVDAIDTQNQETSRTFSVTYTKDAVTWSSPAEGAAYSWDVGIANTVALSATSAAGKSITYSVQSGTLPANVSISGSNITGTPNTTQANTSVIIRATAANTARFADRTIYFATAVSSVTVNFLVVAGGGAGTAGYQVGSGPGGGAGGLRSSTGTSGGGASAESALELTPGVAYPITIGAGGAGAMQDGSTAAPTSGSNTTFATIVSIGGGRSAFYSPATGWVPGADGGSGGGGVGPANNQIAGSGTANQGYNGGATNTDNGWAAAGGGGASSAGGNATSSSGQPGGNGGAGINSDITGSVVGYAGGGGGASYTGSQGTATHGGGSGGFNGATNSSDNSGQNGTANRGGGGGGGSGFNHPNYKGGNGGSGVVVIKIPDSKSASFTAGVSQTMSQSGGFKIYTVTAAGINDTVTFS